MFDKILIANRGEIACRIIATCRRLGIASVAVYSDADANALHVRLADEGRHIGPASARDSYLNIERVIEAARASGAQAIHPGYGFLSENPQLAVQAAAAGLVFIGPPVAAMQTMSSKASARELMQGCGVPVLPGYQGERQDLRKLRAEAERIGYPILIKAVAGGGGKGMRVVAEAAGFEAALKACQREARASFGNERVLLEKYLPAPRHIEVQIFGDTRGTLVHLFERDCSAQRRHQKVIEEAPAPQLSSEQQEGLTGAACDAGRAVGYTGAGTVEFLVDRDGFYFIEMNTRIQVEHPVTEMITGVDLVEWQLRVAAGEPLPLSQGQISRSGHAIEARLYAESPESGFLPSSGALRRFDLPKATRGLRLETGVEAGDTIGIDYDPMLAKLIVHAGTRQEAMAGLQAALAEVRISGVANNLGFLRRLIGSATFRHGAIDTEFIERERESLLPAASGSVEVPPLVLAAAALWTLDQERMAAARTGGEAGSSRLRSDAPSPWRRPDGWRLNALLTRTLRFDAGGAIRLQYRGDEPWLEVEAQVGPMQSGAAHLTSLGHDVFAVRFADQAIRVQISEDAGQLQITLGLTTYRLRRIDPLQVQAQGPSAESRLAAPMPGRIIAQLVSLGEAVARGTPLLIMEAMKMEHTLCAPAEGSVRAYLAEVGAQVQEGTLLIDFEPRA